MNELNYPTAARAVQLMARLRHLQLKAAMRGRVQASLRYAQRAARIRQMLGADPVQTVSV